MQYAEPADIVKNCPMNNIFLIALITHEDLMKNLKSGHDIGGGENRLTIFRLNFAWFSTCLKFSRNTWKSRKDCICFLQLYQEPCVILGKFIMKMLLMTFKSVVAAVTFNKFKYRCKHLNIVSI